MEAQSRELEFYQTENGELPFREWLDNLKDVKGRVVIKYRLDRLRMGNFGDAKSIEEGVYELRVHFGPGYRIYFGLVDNKVVLLLLGGDKKSQFKDIINAKKYWKKYKEKKNESN